MLWPGCDSFHSCGSLLVASIPARGTSSGAPATGSAKEKVFGMKRNVWRAVIEISFIIFLFYSNLLMGEFERSGIGQQRGVARAIEDVFTVVNFAIGTIAALVGYILLEFLRERF
jgi:hypothetical protein